MTYQQAQEKKWQVRKGEKSTTIFFSKPYEIDDDEADDGKRTIRVLKHYAVFHASQIDGIAMLRAQQQRDVRHGNRKRVDWDQIAAACVQG